MIKKLLFSLSGLILCSALTFSMVASASSDRPDRPDKDSPIPKSSTNSSSKSSSSATKSPANNISKVRKWKETNSDTVGWLYVPGTTISDVVVFNKNYRNNFYGTRDFFGNSSKNGTTYSDYRCYFGSGSRNELVRNTVIYGHSWNDNPNGILFAQLKNFKNESFAKSTPYIYLSTEKETIAWEVCAVFDAHVNFPYILSDPPSSYTVPQLLKAIEKSSIYNYNVSVSPTDKVLTLSTCTFSVPGHPNLPEENDYRFVVVAKMVPASQNQKLKSSASFTINPSPVPPDTYSFEP